MLHLFVPGFICKLYIQKFTYYIKNSISIRHKNFTFSKLFQQKKSYKSWKLWSTQYIGCREIVLGTINWMQRNSFIELNEGLRLQNLLSGCSIDVLVRDISTSVASLCSFDVEQHRLLQHYYQWLSCELYLYKSHLWDDADQFQVCTVNLK